MAEDIHAPLRCISWKIMPHIEGCMHIEIQELILLCPFVSLW